MGFPRNLSPPAPASPPAPSPAQPRAQGHPQSPPETPCGQARDLASTHLFPPCKVQILTSRGGSESWAGPLGIERSVPGSLSSHAVFGPQSWLLLAELLPLSLLTGSASNRLSPNFCTFPPPTLSLDSTSPRSPEFVIPSLALLMVLLPTGTPQPGA